VLIGCDWLVDLGWYEVRKYLASQWWFWLYGNDAGGAGGKGVWGKPGLELEETGACDDVRDPNYDSDSQVNSVNISTEISLNIAVYAVMHSRPLTVTGL